MVPTDSVPSGIQYYTSHVEPTEGISFYRILLFFFKLKFPLSDLISNRTLLQDHTRSHSRAVVFLK